MPFGARLVLCVLGISVILAATVAFINHEYIVLKLQKNLPTNQQVELNISDSIIWCVSVLSMQGTYISTKTLFKLKIQFYRKRMETSYIIRKRCYYFELSIRSYNI